MRKGLNWMVESNGLLCLGQGSGTVSLQSTLSVRQGKGEKGQGGMNQCSLGAHTWSALLRMQRILSSWPRSFSITSCLWLCR